MNNVFLNHLYRYIMNRINFSKLSPTIADDVHPASAHTLCRFTKTFATSIHALSTVVCVELGANVANQFQQLLHCLLLVHLDIFIDLDDLLLCLLINGLLHVAS